MSAGSSPAGLTDPHILHRPEAPAVAPHAIFRALGLAWGGWIAVLGPGVEGAETPGELLSLRVLYCPLHARSPGVTGGQNPPFTD